MPTKLNGLVNTLLPPADQYQENHHKRGCCNDPDQGRVIHL
jgi:hypothetical protein